MDKNEKGATVEKEEMDQLVCELPASVPSGRFVVERKSNLKGKTNATIDKEMKQLHN